MVPPASLLALAAIAEAMFKRTTGLNEETVVSVAKMSPARHRVANAGCTVVFKPL